MPSAPFTSSSSILDTEETFTPTSDNLLNQANCGDSFFEFLKTVHLINQKALNDFAKDLG